MNFKEYLNENNKTTKPLQVESVVTTSSGLDKLARKIGYDDFDEIIEQLSFIPTEGSAYAGMNGYGGFDYYFWDDQFSKTSGKEGNIAAFNDEGEEISVNINPLKTEEPEKEKNLINTNLIKKVENIFNIKSDKFPMTQPKKNTLLISNVSPRHLKKMLKTIDKKGISNDYSKTNFYNSFYPSNQAEKTRDYFEKLKFFEFDFYYFKQEKIFKLEIKEEKERNFDLNTYLEFLIKGYDL